MSILIDVAAEFTGAKAFKQADTATDKLGKSVKSLAKTVGLAFSATAVLAFAKASVKAAADDQKAQKQLALALKNVGLERDAASAEGFIQRLQSEFGIVDDKLRPAYQKLAIATRDTTETQKLLSLSLDISAATGKDLDAVTGALSKSYLGSNTALGKLGVGISKADLKAKSFNDITEQLTVTFKGAADAAANTFAGSMAKLGVASQNVKEIIGTGIIDSLTLLSKDHSVDNLTKSMENFAQATADALLGLAAFSDKFKVSASGENIFTAIARTLGDVASAGPLGDLARLGAKTRTAPKPFSTPMSISGQTQTPASKAQLAVNKATLKVSKDSLKLSKAKSIFDLQKIQIEAALKGKISEEERIRLKLMQAIESENIDQIDKYTKMLDEAQKKTESLVATLQSIKPLDDIFKNWSFMSIKEQLASLDTYFKNFAGSAASAFASLGAAQKAALGGYVPFVGASIPSVAGTSTSMPSTVGLGTSGTGNQLPTGVTINTVVEGSVITENDLNAAINNALAQSGWAGYAIGYGRQAVITAV